MAEPAGESPGTTARLMGSNEKQEERFREKTAGTLLFPF